MKEYVAADWQTSPGHDVWTVIDVDDSLAHRMYIKQVSQERVQELRFK